MPKFVDHVDLNGNEIRNVSLHVLSSDPSSPTDGRIYYNSSTDRIRAYTDGAWDDLAYLSELVTTSDVDNAIAAAITGLSWKDSVRAATTGAGTLATSFENGDTLDGVTLATGDRILIKDQAAGAENGIYVVAASGAPARANDADTGTELRGAAVFVEEGTANGNKQFILTTDSVTVGSTSQTWTQFGTGSGGMSKYSSATHSSGASFTIAAGTHGLGATNQLFVQVLEVASEEVVYPTVKVEADGDVVITFASSVSANTYRVTIAA